MKIGAMSLIINLVNLQRPQKLNKQEIIFLISLLLYYIDWKIFNMLETNDKKKLQDDVFILLPSYFKLKHLWVKNL